MTQSQSSLVDPFQGNSILSLHPRTFRDFKVSLKSNDLEAIHQHMSSMALQNPDKHFEEAKSIIDGGSEFLNTKENEATMKENKNPQKNRPALARKRAKFSMKPDTSQPSTIVEPTFQMDQLHDPEEFFAAYERYENTIKELKRQRGEDLNEPKIPISARQRRPEIPRRKVSYQHHVYSSQPENYALYSQETLQDTTESQPTQDSPQESITPNCQSKEKVVASINKTEDKVNKLFDDLMSSNIVDLDGNEALSYLKDHLNIKPVEINNLQLPNFHDIPRVDLFSSANLIKDQNILPDTCALSNSLKERTLGKQTKLPDKPFNPLSSPTPPKSPFLAISTFGKLISKSIEIETNNPFSAHDIELFPTATTSGIISGSSNASKDKEFPVSASKDNLSEPVISMEDHEQGHNMEEMDEDIQGNVEDTVQKAASPTKLNLNIEDNNDNVHLRSEQDIEQNVDDVADNVGSSPSPEVNVDITTAQTDENSIDVPDASVPVQNPDIVPEQQNKECPKKSMNNKKKTRASKVDLIKKRHSLAEAGSSWRAGVRRSKRIKSKPLEYWKGERLLYARVHNSLPTVIGVKYLSSTNDNGKNGFKVESFVADKYKDLVELTSLH